MTSLPAQLGMELWVLRPYARQFAMLPVLGLALGFVQDTAVPIMVVMGIMTSSYGFAVTENSRLETLFATLPTSRRSVVVARYLVAGGSVLGLALLGLGFDAARAALQGRDWSPVASLVLLGASLALAGLVLGIQFPFFFALGYTRARIVTWVAIAAMGALVAMVVLSVPVAAAVPTDSSAGGPPWAVVIGGPLIGLAALVVSAAISIRRYNRKDL